MVFGYNAEYEDKRIYKIVENLNVEVDANEIITSPIQVGFFHYLLVYIMFSSIGLGLGSIVTGLISWDFTITIWNHLFIIFTLPFFYFFWAKMSNSFVILKDDIYVINANFPFKSVRKFKKKEIQKIALNRNGSISTHSVFLSFETPYLDIYSNNGQKHRFYCAPLDIDTYDENLSKHSLDDLYHQLQNKAYPVTTTIKDL